MIDDFFGDAAGFGFFEGAGNVAVERRQASSLISAFSAVFNAL
jgi:hypothetical protein